MTARRRWTLFVALAAAACAAWAVFAAWQTALAVGAGVLSALWLLPALMGLHLGQLMISSRAWRVLLVAPAAGRAAFFRMRLVREGIDSLLPVAQIGGELVGAQLLARHATALPMAVASVVVDVTIEFLTQVVFLLCGLAALAALPSGSAAVTLRSWIGAGVLTAAVAAALVTAQRFGVLRLIEGIGRRIASRFPALAGVSLDGLDGAALGLYGRRNPMLRSAGLHWVAWMLGTFETWAVLQALGGRVTLLQALVIESLGMAARSAGFVVPGALAVQEAGFALAAASVGVPEVMGLSLSAVKRVREIGVGLIGLALWRRH